MRMSTFVDDYLFSKAVDDVVKDKAGSMSLLGPSKG